MTEHKSKNLNSETLLIYWRHARVYWPLLMLCAGGILLNIGCDLLSPLMYKKFLDLLSLDPFHVSTRGTMTDIYSTIRLIVLVARNHRKVRDKN